MTLPAPVQASLAAGEIGPPLWGRTDLAWQASAAKELENFIPTPHGPVKFKGGARFVAEVDDSADAHRLIPYRFSADDAYALIVGDQTIRFGRDKGIITLSGSPVTLASGDGVPWPATSLAALRVAQSFDVLYMFHRSYKPRQLTRASHTSWTIPAFPFKDGPYYPENTTATTLTPSGTGPSGVTLTASAVTGINGGQGFLATDVGRLVRIRDDGGTPKRWFWGTITARADTTHVTVDFNAALYGVAAKSRWRLGLWSDTTGWPAAVALHEGRLATLTLPLSALPRVDLSMSGALDTFSPTKIDNDATNPVDVVSDDCAVSANLTSGELNTPYDLHSLRDLIVLTAGKEFRVNSGSLTEPLTPTNIKVNPISSHGIHPDVDAQEANNTVIFVQRDGRTVRAMTPALDQGVDGYQAKDLTIRSPDIARAGRADADGGLDELAWAQSPNYLLHMVRGDGVMPVLTYLPEQEVQAWARNRFAGSAAGAAVVESVAAIPYGGIDQLWMIVKRTIGGAVQRYVEILEQPLGQDDPIEDAFYVDCGLTLDNTGTVLGYGTLTPGTNANVVDSTGVLLTASTGTFTSADVGKRILYRYVDTVNYRGGRHPRHKHLVWKTACGLITARNSNTVVQVTIEAPFPAAIVGTAIPAADWRLTVSSVSGLSHLEGESIYAWVDGAPQGPFTVASGAITLDTPGATVHAGLFEGGVFEPILALDRETRRRFEKQQVKKIALYLYRSLGGKVTVPDPDDAEASASETILNRTSRDPLGQAPYEMSGWTDPIAVPAGWEKDPTLFIEQDIPGPMMIRAIAPVFEAGEGAG